MYLKSLELHGFKSFPNRTVLTFERGTTVIVGPNGSGKSNISDAMRWVLGELSSRNIRGTKMEDVIFGGTDQRRPMGYAEVSVTFDNTDKNHRVDSPYDEIKVTRRYYRTGDSEYLINGQQRRLRDITELFMNTGIGREGYSIVGQGRVAELLSKKSEDRRNVFEEAAGIAKFRHRKEDAERRRRDTHANMERVIDIFDELEKRITPLTRDAEKARRYLELREQKKVADVSLWLYDTEKLRADLDKARDTYQLTQHELETIEESLASLHAQDERLFSQMESGRLSSEQLLEKINECRTRIHTLENEISVLDTEIRHKTDLVENARRRSEEIDRAITALSSEAGEYGGKSKELREDLRRLSEERLGILADAQKIGQSIQRIEKELDASLATLERQQNSALDLKVNIDVLSRSRSEDGNRKETILATIGELEHTGERLAAEVAQCERNTEGYAARLKEIAEAAETFEKEIEKRRAEREALSEQCGKLRADKAALEQSAEALRRMEEHFEGYGEAVRFVMRAASEGRLRGILGPVSQIINVKPEYVMAIETSLGANLQHIVVKDEDATKAAIRHLKDHRAGRATFYPLTTIRPGNEPEEIRSAAKFSGYIDRADRLVERDAEYDNVIEWLLSRTVIFDTLDHATVCARELCYRLKIVTLDGQVINAGGSYTGGALREGKGSGILSRSAEIESKMDSAKALAADILALVRKMGEKEQEIADIEQEKKDAAQEESILRTMEGTQLKTLEGARARLAANVEKIESFRAELDTITSKNNQIESELATLGRSLENANKNIAAMRERRAEQDVERNNLLDERNAAMEEANTIALREAEINKDIEMQERLQEGVASRLADLRAEKDDQAAAVAEHEDAIASMRTRQTESRRVAAEANDELSKLNERRGETESGVSSFNTRLGEVREQMKVKQEQKDRASTSAFNAENRLRRLEEQQERLGSSLWDDYEITFQDALALDYPPVTAENRAEVAATQAACRDEMKSLGSVNIGAIDEYKEVKERYDEMSAQVLDLRESYDKLTEIIDGLEEEMKAQFVTAFESINDNFGTVFSELFGGGQAELILTDPADVLNCGIDIKAAPPGKIIKNLSLLSGGEQAFVAIALFFAILKVNPTPFCIFDEIEAALDAVNVFRFGEYIKKMCDETQFILISHRPGTMEIAERLYGVTMQERGVSRVLPMSPSEVEVMKKELQEDGVL